MEITIFKKMVKTKAGKSFFSYVTKLVKNDGTEVYCSVKFREGVIIPEEFPCILKVEKSDANLSSKRITLQDGGEYERHILWVSGYTNSGKKYVDHSLDDFE